MGPAAETFPRISVRHASQAMGSSSQNHSGLLKKSKENLGCRGMVVAGLNYSCFLNPHPGRINSCAAPDRVEEQDLLVLLQPLSEF